MSHLTTLGYTFLTLLTLTVIAVIVFFVDAFWDRRRSHEEQELAVLRDIRRSLGHLVLITGDIRDLLKRPTLVKARITLMPKTVNVGETATAVIQGFDQNGQPMTLDSSYTVAYSASNPAAVQFAPPNPDGSDTITALAPEPSDSISAVITGGPNAVNVTATADVLTINAAASVLTTANVVLQ